MPRINLLPWREELRQKRKKEFLVAAAGAVLVGVALTFGAKLFYQGLISNQESRNETLRAEISELDKQIDEINGFEAQKARLLDRMEIIDQLQRSRPAAVHLMDELVAILPAGVHLTEVEQTGRKVELTGNTQSNGRVSSLMRNVDQSEWLRTPVLGGIETTGSGPVAEGEFRLNVEQVPAVEDEEGL
jgi:type IV pilus assembly protein PilN